MGDYKDTIFLPKTSFSMKGNLAQLEPHLLERWRKQNLYQKLRDQSKGRSKFILHWGPPYANGQIHLGHALSETLKDVLNRSMQMIGYDAPLVPGWDCHGLPIEWKVEENFKKQGKNKDEVPLKEFRDACRAFAGKWILKQKEEFQRLGIIADWDHPYVTMDYTSEASTLNELYKLLDSGHLYKGVKPVMWSVVEKTALAEAEIEYEDHTSNSIYVAFPIQNSEHSRFKAASILIWTTTPWSLPGNRAVCFNPDFTYALVDVDGKRLIIAQDLISSVMEKIDPDAYTILDVFPGTNLTSLICQHPLYEDGFTFSVPLLPGNHVSLEAGTGLVHTAPSHGPDDFDIGRLFELEIPETIGEDGFFYAHIPLAGGHHVFKVDPIIIEALKNRNHLVFHEKYVHSYPHSWRSKAPVIYRATAQWFVSMDHQGLREKTLQALDTVGWHPSISQNRMRAMVQNRPDWCVSRQRAWGVPIALFMNKKTGQPLNDHTVNKRILDAITLEGCDAWFTSTPERFLGDAYLASDFEQVRDILDVWFDSGASQAYVLEARDNLRRPAHVYFEGSDQHRGWFQSSLLIGMATRETPPYKNVLTHGFCLDSHGRKFSKSLGNGISPQEVILDSGAEILRLWVIGCDFTDDVRIGPEILKHQQDIYRRFRNTLKYLLGALSDTTRPSDYDYKVLPDLEKWVLHRLAELDRLHHQTLENYGFQGFYGALHSFCTTDLSAFYLDIRKDSLYCDSAHSSQRQGTLYVMDCIFRHLVHWLAPVLCFTAEEAWVSYTQSTENSIHLSLFPTPHTAWYNPESAEKMERLRTLRRVMTTALETARASGVIGSSLGAELHIFDPEGLLPKGINLEELAIVSKVHYTSTQGPENAIRLEGGPFAVTVTEAAGQKCDRCWKILKEVTHELCHRCEAVITTGKR